MIPRSYIALGALLLLGGTWLHGANHGRESIRTQWAAEVAQANAETAKRQAELDRATAAKEAAQAEKTRDLEAEYHAKIKALETGRAAFERRLNDRLRNAEAKYSHCQLSTAAADTVDPESGRPGDVGLGIVSRGAVSRVLEVGQQLQAELLLCKKWARENGR